MPKMLRTMLQHRWALCCTYAAQHNCGKILESLFFVWLCRSLLNRRRVSWQALLLNHRGRIIKRFGLAFGDPAGRAGIVAAGGER